MSKRKRGRAAKAQASSKVRPKAARSGEHKRRANSKQARVLGLLRRPSGATIAAIMTSTSLREKLIKIGAKVVSHGRYVAFQMAEVAIPRQMFQEILRLIAELRPQPPPAPA